MVGLAVALLTGGCCTLALACSPARVTTSPLVIPAYETGPVDVLPPLAVDMLPRSYPVYPYPLQEQREAEKKDKTYESVVLENDYLKLTFLPALGGRLISIYDKVARREVLFRNPVIKPLLVGLRGAWAGIGMEFNFPGSHSVTSHSPIKCSKRQNDDGSASVVLSDIEWVSGMEWRIRITLRPDSIAIQQESAYYNRTPLPHRAYFWTNTKIPARPDTEFLFPSAIRCGRIHPPMDTTRICEFDYPNFQGIDVSKYRNVFCQFPLFVADLRGNWFGCYHKVQDAGILHYADCGTLPGRKIWTLGTGDDAQAMNHAITEDGSPNIEVQAGPLELQTDFMLCSPGVANVWQEYWLPVSGIKNHLHTNLQFSAGFDTTDAATTFYFYSYGSHDAVTASAESDGHAAKATIKKMGPGTVGKIVLAQKLADVRACSLSIQDAKGNELFRYDPKADIAGRKATSEAAAPVAEDAAESQYIKGLYHEERGELDAAQGKYRDALSVDPGFSPALTALGRLRLAQGLVADATDLLNKAVSRNRRNADAHYYLGLALADSGDGREAQYNLERAAADPAFRLPASAAIVAVRAKRGQLRDAFAGLREELLTAEGHLAADLAHEVLLERYLICARRFGFAEEQERAQKALASVHEDNILLATERWLAARSEQFPLSLVAETRANPRLVVWAILYYRDLGLDDDALALSTAAITAGSSDPMVAYVAAWLALKRGDSQKARSYVTAAESHATAGVFPDSTAMLAVLQGLSPRFGDAPKIDYYAGLVLASLGRWEEASRAWQTSVRKGIREFTVFRNLGLCQWKQKKNLAEAVRWYQQGFDPRQINYKYVYEFDMLLAAHGDHVAREKMFAALPESLRTDSFVAVRYAAWLFDTGRYEESIAQLTAKKFSLYEGKRTTHRLFAESHMVLGQRALEKKQYADAEAHFRAAMTYPWNLGVGRSRGRFDMKAQYFLGLTLHRKGNVEGSVTILSQALAESRQYSFPFVALKTIRWETDTLLDDAVTQENKKYEAEIQDLLATIKKERP
jgi:tetratricopeptide (TPR) repeat protein